VKAVVSCEAGKFTGIKHFFHFFRFPFILFSYFPPSLVNSLRLFQQGRLLFQSGATPCPPPAAEAQQGRLLFQSGATPCPVSGIVQPRRGYALAPASGCFKHGRLLFQSSATPCPPPAAEAQQGRLLFQSGATPCPVSGIVQPRRGYALAQQRMVCKRRVVMRGKWRRVVRSASRVGGGFGGSMTPQPPEAASLSPPASRRGAVRRLQ
jgi:hypothetical protein